MSTFVHADPADQAGFTIIPNAVLRNPSLSLGAKTVYGVIKSHAWTDDSAVPGLQRLGDFLGVTPETVRKYVKELVDAKLVKVVRRGQGRTNQYVVLPLTPANTSVLEHDERRGLDDDAASQEVDEGEVEKDLLPHTPANSDLGVAIVEAWVMLAPPLIAHRESYFRDRRTTTAIGRALKKYPENDIVRAIENYATVLGGDEYRWSHSWTIVDFLNRGLDKFVPEADPLNNFRVRVSVGPNMKYGRRDVSAGELLALSERLKSERLELESGEGRSLAP